MNQLVFLTAHQLASKIRTREVSASEVLEAHLDHIARHNSKLNAIILLDEEGARRRAKEADHALAKGEIWGPLHGVLITVKDAFETAGLRTTSSFKPLSNYIPKKDATVVARIRAAGAIILGKTNLPMLAMDMQTHSPLFGRTNNPWNLNYTCGGSAGGSAVSIAAGFSPLEIGSDLGGSIRVPAHYCGVFGFKPTEHLVSTAGHIPGLPGKPKGVRHMGVCGPLARCVQDLQLCLTLIAGPDGRQWEVPPVPLSAQPKRRLQEYRFAWTDDFGGAPVTKGTQIALEKLADTLAEMGCRVERCNPLGFDFHLAWRTFGQIAGAEIGSEIGLIPRLMLALQFGLMSGRSPLNYGVLQGIRLHMPQYVKALTQRDRLIQSMEKFLSEWDAWLCPVSSGPAFPHCKTGTPIEVDGRKVPYLMATTAYTSIFNPTGNPAVVLPLASSNGKLPIGVQVVGQRWRDMELLAVAEALTEVTGPCPRPPGYD